MTAMIRLLRDNRDFRLLWGAELVSLIGDWLSFVTLAVVTLKSDGGVVALAWLFVAHSLPGAVLSPLAGAIADRRDQRSVLFAVQVTELVLTLGLLAAATGPLHVRAAIPALVLARSTAAAFSVPARSAALRATVAPEDLVLANTLDALTWSVTFSIGMAAGGLAAGLGPTLALALDAATFGLSALLLARLPPLPAGEAPRSLVETLRGTLGDTRDAALHAWSKPDLLAALLARTPFAIAGGGAWVLLNVVSEVVPLAGSASVALGALQAIRGAGTGIGPALMARVAERRGTATALRLSAVALGIGLVGLATARSFWLLAVVVLVWGMGIGANWVLSAADLQRLPDARFVGRISSVDNLALTTGMCATALLGAHAIARTGVAASAVWVSLGLGALAYVATQLLPALRAARVPAPEHGSP